VERTSHRAPDPDRLRLRRPTGRQTRLPTMGLFSRKSKDAAVDSVHDVSDELTEADDALASDFTGRPVANPIGEEERRRIAAALERAETAGVDIDDVETIGAHYDEAYRSFAADKAGAEGPDVVVDTFAMAIGEHLARHSARDWAVVTDVFGTDLGLVAARADTVIVPHNLVGARWMRGETGWVPGVVHHLVRLRPRPH